MVHIQRLTKDLPGPTPSGLFQRSPSQTYVDQSKSSCRKSSSLLSGRGLMYELDVAGTPAGPCVRQQSSGMCQLSRPSHCISDLAQTAGLEY